MNPLPAYTLPTTGIGGLPFQTIDPAWQFVAKYCAEFPFVPEICASKSLDIPFLSRFLPNAIHGFPEGRNAQDPSFALALTPNSDFADLPSTSKFKRWFPAAKQLKDQLIGPATTGLILGDYLAPNFSALLDAYKIYIPARLARLREYALPLVFVLDEPLLDVALTDSRYRSALVAVLQEIRSHGASNGIHYCGDRFTPAMFELPVDWLSVDLTTPNRVSNLLSTPGASTFLPTLQGAIFGLLPPIWTQSPGTPVGQEPFNSLLRTIPRGAISPSCGLGRQTQARACAVFEELAVLSGWLGAVIPAGTDSE